MKTIIPMLIGLNCLSLLDAAATLKLVELGATELNPLMAALIEIGPLSFIIIKTLIILSSSFLLYVINKYKPRAATFITTGAVFLFAIIVTYEFIILEII